MLQAARSLWRSLLECLFDSVDTGLPRSAMEGRPPAQRPRAGLRSCSVATRRQGAGTVRVDDAERTRFRRPIGLLVMGYKAALGLTEVVVGAFLAVPGVDPQAIFARLSAEELREDPGDHFVALVTRQLPSLVHHRRPVAVGLILLGLAKLVAAAAMWGKGDLSPPSRHSASGGSALECL
jgi:Predicted membrane protein (DUF2127)